MATKYRAITGSETPDYRSYSSGSASGTTQVTTTWPSNCVNGDYIVLFLATNNVTATTYTTPADWGVLSYDFGTTFSGMSYAIYATTYFNDKSPPTISISGSNSAGQWMMAAFKGVRFSNIDVAFGDYTTNYPEQIGTGGQVVLFAVDNGPGTMFPLFKPGFTNIYGIQQDSSYDVGIMMQYASSASNIGAVGGSAGAGYNWFAISAYLAPGGGVITDLENIFVPRGALRTQSSNLKGWGGNSAGQLGLSDTSTGRSVPTTISTGSWLAVGGSNICTGAIRSDGTLWMTGLLSHPI
jgi:hypothetical protein